MPGKIRGMSVKKKKLRSVARAGKVKIAGADRILAAVRQIPRGRVSTYGDIAQVAGFPRRARLVGTVLRQSGDMRGLPWFRVINAGGRISFPVGSTAYSRQRHKLEDEGVVFRGDRADLKRYGWPSRESLDELLWKPR